MIQYKKSSKSPISCWTVLGYLTLLYENRVKVKDSVPENTHGILMHSVIKKMYLVWVTEPPFLSNSSSK